MLRPALALALLVLVLPPPTRAQDGLPTEVTLTHVAPDRWEVDYVFRAPVSEVRFGPAVVHYRAEAWQVLSPGLAWRADSTGEALVAADSVRRHLRIAVQRYAPYADDQYVPIITASNDGAALYLGYFTGSAVTNGHEVPLAPHFRYEGLPGEQVVPPPTSGGEAYVYFGPQTPAAGAHARLLMDPALPAWLRETFDGVTEAATGAYSARLGGGLAVPPLVFVGAATLDDADGFSIKGGAVGGQIVMRVEGRGLHDAPAGVRAAFERLVAHELAHLWQLHTLPNAYSDAEPWLHEGAAEAMAVQALQASGRWDSTAATRFTTRAAQRCATARAGTPLAEAARQNGDVAYACGFGLYWAGGDPMGTWARFARAVQQEGQPYTQATLDRLITTPQE